MGDIPHALPPTCPAALLPCLRLAEKAMLNIVTSYLQTSSCYGHVSSRKSLPSDACLCFDQGHRYCLSRWQGEWSQLSFTSRYVCLAAVLVRADWATLPFLL